MSSIKTVVKMSLQGETEQPFAVPLLAGMAARVFSVTVVSPLELIRTKMQSQKLSYYGTYKLKFSLLLSFQLFRKHSLQNPMLFISIFF